jgi:outer membrane protein
LLVLAAAALAPSGAAYAQDSVRATVRVDSVTLGTRPITLADALALANKNSPQTIAARGAERSNRAAVRSAYGAFFPSLSASAGATRPFTGARGATTHVNPNGETVTVQGDRWSYSTGYSLSAQLFSLDRFPNLRAAKANVEAAEQNTINQTYDVALSIEQAFFDAIAARENEDAARAQLAQAEQQLDAARRRVVAGAAIASDSLTATVQVANAQVGIITAQNARRNANAALTRLTGSDVPLSAVTTDPAIVALDTITVDSARVVARAAVSPTVNQARAQLDAAHARRQSARASYFPTINGSYSRGGSGADSRFGFGDNPFSYSGSLSLSLSLPIFDRFSRQEQIATATINETNAAATLRDVQLQARQLAVQYLGALRLGQQQVAVQTAAVTAAEENLRVVLQRYDLRLATIVDVLTAQTTLNQARAALIDAHNTVRLSAVQIEALIGQPISTVTVPTSGVTQ